MASNSETGHATNISNFKRVIDKSTSYGTAYDPSNSDLEIASMTTLWTDADNAHQRLSTAIQASKEPINAREILFKPVDKLVTRTLNYFESTKASAQIKKDAKGLADKFRGYKVKVTKLPDGSPDPNDVSKSHLSYVQKADTFSQLVDLYEANTLYAPNEVDLKVSALKPIRQQMKTLNDNIGTIIAPVDTARIDRDKFLYAPGTGIVDIAAAVKDYVVGLFEANSPQAKQMRAIKFRRPRKK